MPFLGKAIETAIKDLGALDEYYGEKEVPIYKPWFFVITPEVKAAIQQTHLVN